MTDIPDMTFSLDLGVTQITFSLSDIFFKDLSVAKVGIQFDGGESFQGSAEGVTVLLTFQWHFQQNSYPYMSDGGEGQLIMDGTSLRVIASTSCDYTECPGHLEVQLSRADLDFDKLEIQLSGGSSWIYQSLIDLIMSAIQDTLADTISDVMVNSLTQLMYDQMKGDGYNQSYYAMPSVTKDDRFVGPL